MRTDPISIFLFLSCYLERKQSDRIVTLIEKNISVPNEVYRSRTLHFFPKGKRHTAYVSSKAEDFVVLLTTPLRLCSIGLFYVGGILGPSRVRKTYEKYISCYQSVLLLLAEEKKRTGKETLYGNFFSLFLSLISFIPIVDDIALTLFLSFLSARIN